MSSVLYGDICPLPGVMEKIKEPQGTVISEALNRTAFLLTDGNGERSRFLLQSSLSNDAAREFWEEQSYDSKHNYCDDVHKDNTLFHTLRQLLQQTSTDITIGSVAITGKLSQDLAMDKFLDRDSTDITPDRLIPRRIDRFANSLSLFSLNILLQCAQYRHEEGENDNKMCARFVMYPLVDVANSMWAKVGKSNDVCVHAIKVYGRFKSMYGEVAKACEKRLFSFLQTHLINEQHQTMLLKVRYQSSQEGGNSLHSDWLTGLTSAQKEKVINQLTNQYNFIRDIRPKIASANPPPDSSYFIIIASDRFHEFCKTQLEKDLTLAHRVPISVREVYWDLSNLGVAEPQKLLSELQKNSKQLGNIRELSLRENGLGWFSHRSVFDYILNVLAPNMPSLVVLDLSLNALSVRGFREWVGKMFEALPSLCVIDLTGGCSVSISEFPEYCRDKIIL